MVIKFIQKMEENKEKTNNNSNNNGRNDIKHISQFIEKSFSLIFFSSLFNPGKFCFVFFQTIRKMFTFFMEQKIKKTSKLQKQKILAAQALAFASSFSSSQGLWHNKF